MESMDMVPVIVPWFSRKEWLEVFRNTYSNDVDRWMEARDTMLVWQARVQKLPIGVDLTLPLLQAKIVDADPQLDSVVKSIMQATALQRFVSSVVKLPQTEYYSSQTLHKLASNIGLPGHLVDLRNEIIHGDSGWTGGCTVTIALETSYKWVKDYYWTTELHQMNEKKDFKMSKHTTDFYCFLKNLRSYARRLFTKAVDGNDRNCGYITSPSTVINAYCSVNPTEQNDCLKAVINHLLTPPEMADMLNQPGKTRKKAKCKCFFKDEVMNMVNEVIGDVLNSKGAPEQLLSGLITNLKENREMSIAWINILMRSYTELPSVDGKVRECKKHLLLVDKESNINWKKVAHMLLNTEEEWATSLALRLMSAPETSFLETQVQQVANLLCLFKCDDAKKEINDDAEIDDDDDDEKEIDDDEIDDDDDAEKEIDDDDAEKEIDDDDDAEKHNGKKAKKIDEFELYDVSTVVETSEQSSMDSKKVKTSLSTPFIMWSRTPLGILPHQQNHKNLYKELLLHYPGDVCDGPPLKRKKC